MAEILAASSWASNAEMIVACRTLGYLRDTDAILDPTYGRGVWWKVWRPRGLVTHDLKIDGVDFRHLPEPDGTFDAVTFDPPYAPMGGRDTSTLSDYNERYGRDTAPKTPEGVRKLGHDGLAECLRVVKPRGIVAYKCMDFIWSGRLHPASHWVYDDAVAMGFDIVDKFIHVGKVRPQPKGRSSKCAACKGSAEGCDRCEKGRIPTVQQHARQNGSILYVFRAPKATPARLAL